MALPELPRRQQGPDHGYTEEAHQLQHQQHRPQPQPKSASRPAARACAYAHAPPAASPIEAACAQAPVHAATAQDTTTRATHDDFVTTDARVAAPGAAATSSSGNEMWQKHFKHLPKGTKPVTFVGEGAANAVFEIKIPHHGLRDQSFKGLLLRVAKVPLLGQPTKYNYVWQQNFYQTAILPLLGSHAIHQELVILRNSGIVDELNRLLQDIDHTRKPKFRGSFVGQSDWGLLIEDMRPDPMAPPPRSTLVEFKPKWLSQSRSAPARAVRCRQCALELQRLLTRSCPVSAAGGLPCDRKPCPLALVEDDAPSAVSSPFRIAPKLASSPERARLEPLLQRILRDPFLDDLRAQQENLDLTGPLLASAEDEQFSVAMTLRDCTCFALLPGDSTATEAEVKIRLGDLDWKDPRTKIQHWRGTEQALIDGGFYTADWILYDGVYYYPPTLCLLEWKTRSPAHGKPDIIELQELSTNGDATATTAAHTYKHQADVAALTAMLQPYSGAGSESKPANPYRPPPQ